MCACVLVQVVEDLTKECEYLLEVLKTMDARCQSACVRSVVLMHNYVHIYSLYICAHTMQYD